MSLFRRDVVNPNTLLVETEDLPLWQLALIWTGLGVVVVALFIFYLWFYTSVLGLELPKTTMLKRQNIEWKSNVQILEARLESYESALEAIEIRDDKVYRMVFGFKDVEKPAPELHMRRESDLDKLSLEMSGLMKRTVLQSRSLEEIGYYSQQAGDMVSCIPSVPPVHPAKGNYRLSSSFGYRTDPVYGGRRMHSGMDFAAPIGTDVFSTADGVVESVKHQFTGYGNQIVIDHGFGYKTRFAHLSATLVTPGMKVHRGDVIGRIGKSGKSTGPHLHYEVIYRGKYVNPWNYMDLGMPVEEFDAMLGSRQADLEFNRINQTSAILERATKNSGK